MATIVPLQNFDSEFGSAIELSSKALGGHIVSVSDDFFAEAHQLLSVPPSQSLKGQFGPKGALFDGWESRRHNPSYDWVIVRIGAPLGSVMGFDIDTGHFNGNESPASGVWGADVPDGQTIEENSAEWKPLLPITPLGPAQRHLFKLPSYSEPLTHLKLTMHPDGGIGRFRAYGKVLPPPRTAAASQSIDEAVDLAHVLSGATVVGESDQHFGRGANLILPGRGKDMGDGWETKRSRGRLGKGLGDWVVIRLGEPGHLEWADIDTNHFVGNFPESVELHGISSEEHLPAQDAAWVSILAKTKVGPHRQHFFQLSNRETAFTHVRLSIYPDGGVKRVRLFGRPAALVKDAAALAPLKEPMPAIPAAEGATASSAAASSKDLSSLPRIPALPLTPDAFAPYGSVIQSYPDERSARKDVVIKSVNFGTGLKYNHLAPVTYVPTGTEVDSKAEINFCVFRCAAQDGARDPAINNGKQTWAVDVLERHKHSTQAFSPMGGGGSRYLALVALNDDKSDKPDLTTLRAFIASDSQGISYAPNVWHHPLMALEKVTDFACLVYETGVSEVDCEIMHFASTVAVVHEV